ncbi:hypothetical protein [Metapseudomonas sp. CR1201]
MGSFKEAVRQKKIAQPINDKFSLDTWKKKWDETTDKDSSDSELYEAGIVFYTLLSEVRQKLHELYEESSPGIKPKRLLELYCGVCNRDWSIISSPDTWSLGDGRVNVHSFSTKNNAGGNEITIDEAATVNIDGLHKAIGFTYKKAIAGNYINKGRSPIDELEFVKAESYLSQLYGLYENYWQALLWGGYEFELKDGKFVEVRQSSSEPEIAYEISQKRRMKLETQAAIRAADPGFYTQFNKTLYVVPEGSGKTKNYSVSKIGDASKDLIFKNSEYFSSFETVLRSIPESLLLAAHGKSGFTVVELIQVFRHLRLLAVQLKDKLPQDSECMSPGKLREYNVKINKNRLCLALIQATELAADKVYEIFDFIVFSKINKQDLWCHPIVHGGGDDYYVILGAMADAVLMRVVENWLAELDLKLSEKGATYESRVCELVGDAVRDSEVFNDVDGPASRRIKLKGKSVAKPAEEEIDFIFRFGDVILVGEAKSIVTTDSPISYFRTLDILVGAAKQAKRKAGFVKDNLELVFGALGWKWSGREYNVVPLVLSSNKMHVGFPVLDVPVVDESILSGFFRSNVVPLVSVPVNKTGFDHVMWFEIYDGFDDSQQVIEKYLKSPPQIQDSKESFELSPMYLPYVFEDSYRVIYSRLKHRDVSASEYVSRSHAFPLKEKEGAREIITEFGIVF